MLKLKVQNKKFNNSTEIDKFALIPKKYWESFEEGINQIIIDGTRTKVRVYSIPCACIGSPHEHRIIDLRSLWTKLNLESKKEVEIDK